MSARWAKLPRSAALHFERLADDEGRVRIPSGMSGRAGIRGGEIDNPSSRKDIMAGLARWLVLIGGEPSTGICAPLSQVERPWRGTGSRTFYRCRRAGRRADCWDFSLASMQSEREGGRSRSVADAASTWWSAHPAALRARAAREKSLPPTQEATREGV